MPNAPYPSIPFCEILIKYTIATCCTTGIMISHPINHPRPDLVYFVYPPLMYPYNSSVFSLAADNYPDSVDIRSIVV